MSSLHMFTVAHAWCGRIGTRSPTASDAVPGPTKKPCSSFARGNETPSRGVPSTPSTIPYPVSAVTASELIAFEPASMITVPDRWVDTTRATTVSAQSSSVQVPRQIWLPSLNTYVPGRASVTPDTYGPTASPGVDPTETTSIS